ncbi:MAG: hypothetical protein EAZ08_09415 [Cytophagales bacterium]|nr:MAG: hypothetical protein EAZ08_09415 [Cytophagales bacterium]
MKVGIMGYFTSVGFRFDLNPKVKKKIMDLIDTNILTPFPLPKIKATVLEILLNTDGISTENKVVRISKTDKGKYLSFMFYLPYPKIVKNEIVDLEIFIQVFFDALKEALSLYAIPEDVLEQTKQEVLCEIVGKEEYLFEISSEQLAWRSVAKKLRQESQIKV